MNRVAARPPQSRPRASTDGLDVLVGSPAGDLLAAATRSLGGRLLSWRVRHVDHQPGRNTTVGYSVRLGWPGGETTDEMFGATTDVVPEGGLVLDDGRGRVTVWRFPYDPRLPGLPIATDPAAVAGLLGRLGFGAAPPGLAVRGYRPGRRAVIQASGERGSLYLKVVRADRVRRLHERHRRMCGLDVPVPPSLGYTDEGVVVLQGLPGRTLRARLRSTHPGPLPAAADILDVLDRLPATLAAEAPRRSWLDRAGHYAGILAAVLPEQAQRIWQLAESITKGSHSGPDSSGPDSSGPDSSGPDSSGPDSSGPVVAVHGDLYDSQLLVRDGHITGLLDIDTAGAGERVDDLGCLLGHLSVLSRTEPRHAPAIDRLAAAYRAEFARTAGDAELRRRAAAVALSLATGPHRVQLPGWRTATRRRLDVVESWLDGTGSTGRHRS